MREGVEEGGTRAGMGLSERERCISGRMGNKRSVYIVHVTMGGHATFLSFGVKGNFCTRVELSSERLLSKIMKGTGRVFR